MIAGTIIAENFILEGRDDEARLERARVIGRIRLALAILSSTQLILGLALKCGTAIAVASIAFSALVVVVLALTGNVPKLIERLLAQAEAAGHSPTPVGPILAPAFPSPSFTIATVALPTVFLVAGWYAPPPAPTNTTSSADAVSKLDGGRPSVGISNEMASAIKDVMGLPPPVDAMRDGGNTPEVRDGGTSRDLRCVARVYSEWRSLQGRSEIRTRYLDSGCWQHVPPVQGYFEEVWRMELMLDATSSEFALRDVYMKLGATSGVVTVPSRDAKDILRRQGLIECVQIQILSDYITNPTDRDLTHMHVDSWCGREQ